MNDNSFNDAQPLGSEFADTLFDFEPQLTINPNKNSMATTTIEAQGNYMDHDDWLSTLNLSSAAAAAFWSPGSSSINTEHSAILETPLIAPANNDSEMTVGHQEHQTSANYIQPDPVNFDKLLSIAPTIDNAPMFYDMSVTTATADDIYRVLMEFEQQPQSNLNNDESTQNVENMISLVQPSLQQQEQLLPNLNQSYGPNVSIPANNSHALDDAKFTIYGNLDSMTYDWKMEEKGVGRRIVNFWREASVNSTGRLTSIECGFINMDTQEYQQRINNVTAAAARKKTDDTTDPMSIFQSTDQNNPIVVSCIYWQEKGDFYITSVDFLHLLEGLIGITLTIEEKNRIRRNLEKYNTSTLSKSNQENSAFFKHVMDLPHPRPRKIQKDVKVFSWRMLHLALRDVVMRYTSNFTYASF